jgi:hypothetical protein
VDVEPLKLLPTWRNGRGGQDYIAKRLDRFLIFEDLVISGFRYRSVVCNLNIYDHMPVILHLEKDNREVSNPSNLILFGWKNQNLLTLSYPTQGWAIGSRDIKSYGFFGKKNKDS